MISKNKFYKKLLILSAVIALLIIGLQQFTQYIPHVAVWWIYLYHISLTIVSFIMMDTGIKKGGLDFVNYFMGVAAIRLLLSCIVLFLYFFLVKQDSITFVIMFFLMYFLYTLFEIKTLLTNLRHN